MAEEKRKFQRGDFLKKNNKKGSFMIYEGNNLSETAYKKMTLVCNYDPAKYQMGTIGYEEKPFLEVASKSKPCTTTIDTDIEDYWYHICSDEEKKEALDILTKYGFYWDENELQLVDVKTGEIIRKIVIPDDKYHGQIIKPITENSKDLIKKYCRSKLTPAYYNNTYDNEYLYD